MSQLFLVFCLFARMDALGMVQQGTPVCPPSCCCHERLEKWIENAAVLALARAVHNLMLDFHQMRHRDVVTASWTTLLRHVDAMENRRVMAAVLSARFEVNHQVASCSLLWTVMSGSADVAVVDRLLRLGVCTEQGHTMGSTFCRPVCVASEEATIVLLRRAGVAPCAMFTCPNVQSRVLSGIAGAENKAAWVRWHRRRGRRFLLALVA